MSIKIEPPKTAKINSLVLDKVAHEKEKKEFVKEANKHVPLGELNSKETINESEQTQFPWENPIVRKDVTRLFNLRLSEPDWLKLKYLAERSGVSMHAFCLDILIPTMQRRLKKILEKEQL